MAMTRTTESAEALATLRDIMVPGSTVYTILRHRSRSGMMRVIEPITLAPGVQGLAGVIDRHWTYAVSRALGWSESKDYEGIKVSGAGMDMGFHLVYTLSRTLYPDGFDCIGKGCPANDHTNAWNAYANGHCFVCGEALPDFERGAYGLYEPHRDAKTSSPYTRDGMAVWPAECQTKTLHHRDGGYALRHRWL